MEYQNTRSYVILSERSESKDLRTDFTETDL